MSKTIPQLGISATLSLTDKAEVSQSDSPNANSLNYTFSRLLSEIVNTNAQLAAIGQVTGLTAALAAKFNVSGGALTGAATAAADPTVPLGLATKQYVDNSSATVALQTAYDHSVNPPSITLTNSGLTFYNSDSSLNSSFAGNGNGNTFYGNLFVQDSSGDVFNVDGTSVIITNNADQGTLNPIAEILVSGKTVNGSGKESFRFLTGFNNDTSGQPDSSFSTIEVLDANTRNTLFGVYGTDAIAGSRAIFGGTNANSTITSVSINAANINPNAILQTDSTTKGILPVRMTTAQMNAIPVTPDDAGLEVYVTDLVDGYYYFDGENWVYLDNNSGAGNTLQAAYDAGNTISLASGTPIVISTQGSITNFAYFSNGGPATYTTDTIEGTQFTPSSNCFVTALEYVDMHFSSGQRQVGIYRVSDQALIVSDLVEKSDPLDSTTNYRVHSINPVPLQAGVTYIVVSIIPANEPFVYYSNALVPTPGISNTGNTFGQTASTLVFPTTINTTPNTVYGNGSFQFSVSTSTLNINDGTQKSLFTAASTVQGTIPFAPMSTTQFAAISSPPKALGSFDNVLNQLTMFDGTIIQTIPWDSSVVHLAGTETITGVKTFSSTISGNISGNAATATVLQTARAINGVNFDGSAPITVPAAAGTLTGTTLNSSVVASSLTSVGVITSGTWSGSFGTVSGANLTSITPANISAGTAPINISGVATDANNIFVLPSTTTNASFSIPFCSATNGYEAMWSNTTLVYNPSTLRFGSTNLITVAQTYLCSGMSNLQAIGLFGGNISLVTSPASNDTNHFLGYYGSAYSKTFAGITNIDGPVLAGYSGGVLGMVNGNVATLQWNSNGITITNSLILTTATAGYTQKSVAVSGGVANGSFNTGVTLVAGTVTISNSYVTALCSATVTVSTSGGTPSLQGYRVVVGAGTYTITGLSTDTSILNVAFTKGN